VTDPDWVGIEHGPDEGVSEEVLRRALKIYIMSIARLMELDLA
jgi:succinyl-diaminopimelate desuccinylase